MKKRIILIALTLALTVSTLSGCGEKKNASEPTPSPIVTESPSPSPEAGTDGEQADADTSKQESQLVSGTQTSAPSSKPATSTPTKQPTKAPSAQAPSTQAPATSAPVQTPAATPAPVPSPSVSELMGKMVGALDKDTHNLSEMPAELYEGVFQINPSDYEGVLIYGSMMNIKANEIIVIKAKNQAGVDAAKKALKQRHEALDNQWKRYLPDQYELVKAGTITTNGLYATLVIAEGGSKAVSAFNSALK